MTSLRDDDAALTTAGKQLVHSVQHVFEHFVHDESFHQEHVMRALIANNASTMDFVAAKEPTRIPDAAFVVNALSDNNHASFNVLRQRQVALLECFLKFDALAEDAYMSMDLAVHISLDDALMRYVTAWIRFYTNVELGYNSNIDLEMILATLGDVLAVFSIGYNFTFSGFSKSSPIHSAALQDVLKSLARAPVAFPARKMRDFARGLRVKIRAFVPLTLIDAFFFVVTSLRYWDVNLPRMTEKQLLVQYGVFGGDVGKNPSMIQKWVLGYPIDRPLFTMPITGDEVTYPEFYEGNILYSFRALKFSIQKALVLSGRKAVISAALSETTMSWTQDILLRLSFIPLYQTVLVYLFFRYVMQTFLDIADVGTEDREDAQKKENEERALVVRQAAVDNHSRANQYMNHELARGAREYEDYVNIPNQAQAQPGAPPPKPPRAPSPKLPVPSTKVSIQEMVNRRRRDKTLMKL